MAETAPDPEPVSGGLFHAAGTSNAQFELSAAGIQTDAKSLRSYRCFSQEEVSLIQITTMEETHTICPWDCLVSV